MKRALGTAAAVLLLTLLGASPMHAAGEPRIVLTMAGLKSLKINFETFQLAVVSKDGNTLIGTEKIRDPKLKAKGQVWKLHVFHLDWAAQKATLSTIPALTTSLEQMAISPDGKWALLLGDRGTRFVAVDLTKNMPRVVFRNERGKPGFRSQPEVAWWEKGKFHTPGYFYDAAQAVTGDAVASIDAGGDGLAAITKVRDIDKLYRQTRGFAVQQWYSSEQSYFALVKPDQKMHLVAAMGEDMLPIESALGYGGMAVGQDRVVYAARWDKNTVGVVVQDIGMKKKWRIGDASKLYNYLYMSDDGGTVLVSHLDVAAQAMTTWFGREAESWKLRPVPGIEAAKPGTIRFSSGGEVYAFYNLDGLLIGRLPK